MGIIYDLHFPAAESSALCPPFTPGDDLLKKKEKSSAWPGCEKRSRTEIRAPVGRIRAAGFI